MDRFVTFTHILTDGINEVPVRVLSESILMFEPATITPPGRGMRMVTNVLCSYHAASIMITVAETADVVETMVSQAMAAKVTDAKVTIKP